MTLPELLLYYGLAINLFTFLAFGWDKWRAKREKSRVSEANLCWLTLIGGVAGAALGMKAFRHKTVKSSFRRKWFLAAFVAVVWMGTLSWYLIRSPIDG